MKKIVIDFKKYDSIDDFYDFIREKLDFGDEFGNNLDALNDEIGSLSGVEFKVEFGGKTPVEFQEIVEEILSNCK